MDVDTALKNEMTQKVYSNTKPFCNSLQLFLSLDSIEELSQASLYFLSAVQFTFPILLKKNLLKREN